MYLSSLIFFTSTVSSASDSTLKHLKPRIASLSTEAIRYNAPWQPPAPDSSSGRCGHLKALVNMLFTTTLGIIDFFPIAGSWGMAGPHGVPMVSPMDDSWRATWGDPVVISEPSDSGRQGTTACSLQDVAGCCRFLTLNSSVSWFPVPGQLNFGDAVRCQTGYMQVAKAGNRQQTIALKHNESQPMEKNRSDLGMGQNPGT